MDYLLICLQHNVLQLDYHLGDFTILFVWIQSNLFMKPRRGNYLQVFSDKLCLVHPIAFQQVLRTFSSRSPRQASSNSGAVRLKICFSFFFFFFLFF